MRADPEVTMRVPLARPNIGELEADLVRQVLLSGTLSIGPMVEAFEAAVANLVGAPHAVACSSGTAGLHLVVRALGLADGDEVLTTPFSFVASANSVLFERATPIFVDIEETTLGMDPALIASLATARTKAILPVHVFGKPCRIGEMSAIATRNGWSMIEDSCEALGSRIANQACGTFGDAGVFAFYPNKQITAGEGGMVVTADADLVALLRSMRNQGRDEDGTWLRHVRLGFNYRLDELSAAVGLGQMQRYDQLRQGRARVAARYASRLGGETWLTLPGMEPGSDVDWFVYVVRLAAEIDRNRAMEFLAQGGVSSRPYFVPLHLQPYYQERFGFKRGDFPVTEQVARSTLALPFGSDFTDDEVDYVCERLTQAVNAQ